METMLGIDLGTSGVKAIVLRADGQVLASATAEYPLAHPYPGWAEQDPEEWWQGTIKAIRECLEQAGSTDLRGLAISGQMHGAVLLDATDAPIRPAIIWSDTRCQAECDAMTTKIGAERLIDLVSNPALPGFTAPKLLWVRNHEPEHWARVRRVLLPKDYIRLRLTGTAAMEISDAAGTCLLDVVHGQWSREVMAALDLDPALFPPIVGSAMVAGQITAQAGELTGLPVGLLVAGGGADNACAAVGAGIVAPGAALVSIGTSGVVLAYSATPQVDRSGPIPRAHTFNHAVPDAWYLMGVTQAAGLSLRWLRDEVCLLEAAMGKSGGRDPYTVMSEAAARVAPGSDGLIFLPYLQGERTPILDAAARGGWIGLTARHQRGHLIRSVMEGVAYSLRDCLDVLRATGVGIASLRATGGGARSYVWRQILADAFDLPVIPLATEEGPALGAALLVGVAVGVYGSIPEACAAVVRTGEPSLPNPTGVAALARGHAIYRTLYPALRDAMHALGNQP